MFRIEFLLNPENQSSEKKSSVGSKRKEEEVGKKEIGISSVTSLAGFLLLSFFQSI